MSKTQAWHATTKTISVRTVTVVVLLVVTLSGSNTATGGSGATGGGLTYYVDSADGKDDSSGLSENAAWQSLTRVNSAKLTPGDIVRFRCGGNWRGSLRPASGAEAAPITYTSYGVGPKPLLLGSVSCSQPQDWVHERQSVWATRPDEYQPIKQVADLRQGKWTCHQEAGADVRLTQEMTGGGQVVHFTCSNSGKASNHVQAWGPKLAVEKGSVLLMAFRARSSKPLRLGRMTIVNDVPPWNRFGTAAPIQGQLAPQWSAFTAIFEIAESSNAGRLHISLGGILPEGSVFDFQPISVHLVTVARGVPLPVDVGNVIFDNGKACGWKKWSVGQLDKPNDYYYDRVAKRVFLNSQTNPAAQHTSIELALKQHIVNQSNTHHVVYDGLAVRYGAAHGFGGGETHHLTIRNCDVSYIGGGQQLARPNGTPVRYGNGIEFWNAAHDNLVENCRIWEIYDAALTNQGRSPSSKQVNITYRNNIIWNAEYSFEYWNHPATALTKNIRFINNTCVNAGTVWSHAQRPTQNGSHLMFYSNTAVTSGIEIKYNIFCNATQWGSRYSSGWKTLPELDYNLWFSQQGVTANWFGKKIARFDDYRRETGLDEHSRFAKPRFIDIANGDFRLKPDSPARHIRPDHGRVGAEFPWE